MERGEKSTTCSGAEPSGLNATPLTAMTTCSAWSTGMSVRLTDTRPEFGELPSLPHALTSAATARAANDRLHLASIDILSFPCIRDGRPAATVERVNSSNVDAVHSGVGDRSVQVIPSLASAVVSDRSAFWCQLEQASALSAAFVLEHPKRAVRSFNHGANTRAHGVALDLAGALAIQLDTDDRLRRQPCNEGIAAPVREKLAPIEHQVPRRDHRSPRDCRLLEFRARFVIWNRVAIVVIAVRHDRVAIVASALDEVQLVAALGSHFDRPQPALEIEGDAERIAVTERPDLAVNADVVDECITAGIVDEGIVPGCRSVILQAQDLAEIGLHILGWREFLAIAGCDPEIAGVVEQQPVAVVAVAELLGILSPDDLDVGKRGAILGLCERGADDCCAARATGAALGEAQVDQPVLRELRVKSDVAQAALAAVVHVGYAGDLPGHFALRRDDEEIALLLRHQHSAVGQYCERPGLVERGDRLDLERWIHLGMRNGGDEQAAGNCESLDRHGDVRLRDAMNC